MYHLGNSSFINRPLFEALRQKLDLPVVNHGIFFAPEKEDSEHRFARIDRSGDPEWEDIKPKEFSCRLQKHSFYVQYTSKTDGLLTMKVDLRGAGAREITPVFVLPEEYPPCRERGDKAEGENAFYGHDETGTEEWTWSWAEPGEENTKEKRREHLAAYILPEHPAVEYDHAVKEDVRRIIPQQQSLTNYRLCEVRDLRGNVRRLLTSAYQKGTPDMMHLCCGDIFSTWGPAGPTLLSSGIALNDTTWFTNIIGIYSESMEYCYALSYALEGLYVVWFKLRTVNP